MNERDWRDPTNPKIKGILKSNKPKNSFKDYKIEYPDLKFTDTKIKYDIDKNPQYKKYIPTEEKGLHKFLYGTLLQELYKPIRNTEQLQKLANKIFYYNNRYFHTVEAGQLLLIFFDKLKYEIIKNSAITKDSSLYKLAYKIAKGIEDNKRIQIANLRHHKNDITSLFYGSKSKNHKKSKKKSKSKSKKK